MIIDCHLIVSRSGKVRVNKGGGGLLPDEVAIGLRLNLPNRLFERPVLSATIRVSEDAISSPDLNTIVEITARDVAGALRIDVNHVRDGLLEAIDRHNTEEK